MWNKPQKHRKQTAAAPDVIELYKNSEFVSDSLDTVCASAVKITADGQITTKTIGKMGDRHLQAELKLPGLQERCAVSTNKDLFRLSTILADYEAHHQIRGEIEDLYMGPEMQKNKQRMQSNKLAHVHCKDCKFVNAATNFSDQLEGPPIKLQRAYMRETKHIEVPREVTPPTVRRKQKKIKKSKPPQINIQSGDSTDASYYETATSNRQSPKYKKRTVHQSIPTYYEQSMPTYCEQSIPTYCEQSIPTYCEHKAEQLISQLKSYVPEEKSKPATVDKLVANLKGVAKFIDDWYCYTLLLFLAAVVYLVYVLCFDISLYISEERRYLAKMRSACLVAKCFYYIMRLLRVPIF